MVSDLMIDRDSITEKDGALWFNVTTAEGATLRFMSTGVEIPEDALRLSRCKERNETLVIPLVFPDQADKVGSETLDGNAK